MGQRIAYGTTTIALLLALFATDAAIGRWASGTDQGLNDALGQIPGPAWLSNLLSHGSVLPFFFLIVMLKGAGELITFMRAAGIEPHVKLAYLGTAAVFLSPWLSAGGILGSDVQSVEGLLWPLVLLAFTAMAAAGAQLVRGTPLGSIKDFSGTMLPVLYVGFLSSFALQLRCGADTAEQRGVWLMLASILVAKGSDIGAYFVGSAIGRRKLMPQVSPGKSVEGTIAGLLSSVVVALLFAFALPLAARLGAEGVYYVTISEITAIFGASVDAFQLITYAIIFGLVLSFVGQIGDLFESCLKRDAGTKDSGMIMPQFGGILDVIDSAIFAMPAAWFLLTRVWRVG
jgi:phosphatidate cytidylyltransferase